MAKGCFYDCFRKKRLSNAVYDKKHITRLSLAMPNAEADRMKFYLQGKNIAVNAFIREAIKEKLDREEEKQE